MRTSVSNVHIHASHREFLDLMTKSHDIWVQGCIMRLARFQLYIQHILQQCNGNVGVLRASLLHVLRGSLSRPAAWGTQKIRG